MASVHTKELHRAAKTVTKAGSWKQGGKANMPKSAFPLGRGRSYQLGAKWTWRVDHLDAAGCECRLLTTFQPEKQSFMAMLTVKQGPDYVVAASLEFHGDHPGWHVHASCCRIEVIDVGPSRPRDALRLPQVRRKHRRDKFVDVSESSALNIAFKFFNVVGLAETESDQGSLL